MSIIFSSMFCTCTCTVYVSGRLGVKYIRECLNYKYKYFSNCKIQIQIQIQFFSLYLKYIYKIHQMYFKYNYKYVHPIHHISWFSVLHWFIVKIIGIMNYSTYHKFATQSLHLMNVRVSNISSVKRHLSGRKTLPAMLNSHSTVSDDAGIGTGISQVQWNPCITTSQGKMHFGRYIEVAFAEGFSLV